MMTEPDTPTAPDPAELKERAQLYSELDAALDFNMKEATFPPARSPCSALHPPPQPSQKAAVGALHGRETAAMTKRAHTW